GGGALSREACAKRVLEAPSHFHAIASGRSVGSARRSVSREEGRGGHTYQCRARRHRSVPLNALKGGTRSAPLSPQARRLLLGGGEAAHTLAAWDSIPGPCGCCQPLCWDSRLQGDAVVSRRGLSRGPSSNALRKARNARAREKAAPFLGLPRPGCGKGLSLGSASRPTRESGFLARSGMLPPSQHPSLHGRRCLPKAEPKSLREHHKLTCTKKARSLAVFREETESPSRFGAEAEGSLPAGPRFGGQMRRRLLPSASSMQCARALKAAPARTVTAGPPQQSTHSRSEGPGGIQTTTPLLSAVRRQSIRPPQEQALGERCAAHPARKQDWSGTPACRQTSLAAP
ncbi:unnamed protein product, partial [Soboliphyme baturini]|uniref:Kinesin motor domain-containing protein n=1 Tax=Soboliphyme baturini TaxID=241478 RepID=A0A183IA73_9BILA